MHRFLVPPEAIEPTTVREPWGWTVEGVTLTSLLALTIPLTASLTFLLAPAAVPCTALVAYGFWRISDVPSPELDVPASDNPGASTKAAPTRR